MIILEEVSSLQDVICIILASILKIMKSHYEIPEKNGLTLIIIPYILCLRPKLRNK